MKKFKLYLNILQIEEYDLGRFLKWVWKHPGINELEGKKPLVWTAKIKLLHGFMVALLPVSLFMPWLTLSMGVVLLQPIEEIILAIQKRQTRQKINRLKTGGLKVIGVAGSYGKTSVKEALFILLSGKYKVYRTPESYNTVKGITKAVDLELNEKHQVFICEMGEYKPGDIKEICEMTDPDLGIITGVNEQHAERMGNIHNALKTVFELYKYVQDNHGKVWLNTGDSRIKEFMPNSLDSYGEKNYETPLEQNIEGAMKVAKFLGVTDADMRKKLIKPFKHRLEVKRNGEMTLIDDAYNSNPDGFAAAIKYLATFSQPRIIVTPGIVELGAETERIHRELGEKMKGVVDKLVLVGKNERTNNLAATFDGEIKYLDSVHDWEKEIVDPKSTVLFENDLPDNY